MGIKGYHFYNPSTKQFSFSRNVIFDEHSILGPSAYHHDSLPQSTSSHALSPTQVVDHSAICLPPYRTPPLVAPLVPIAQPSSSISLPPTPSSPPLAIQCL